MELHNNVAFGNHLEVLRGKGAQCLQLTLKCTRTQKRHTHRREEGGRERRKVNVTKCKHVLNLVKGVWDFLTLFLECFCNSEIISK